MSVRIESISHQFRFKQPLLPCPSVHGEPQGRGRGTYVEHRLRLLPARNSVPLGQRNQLLGHALRLLRLGVRRLDVLVHHQRRHLAAQQRLARRGVAAQVPKLGVSTSHCRGLL